MLRTKEPLKDLGKIKIKETKGFSYDITNESPKTVTIDKVTVGCGSCTKAHLLKKFIEPNGMQQLKVSFTPGTTGPQKKYVNIRYNETESLKVEFTAEVYE